LPPKGIPLPLVSYGKTEMLVSLVSIGVLLNLSREVNA
jgi:cell division protein FtsW (lipid II flippase)